MRSGEETAEVCFMVCVVDFIRIRERKGEFRIYSLVQFGSALVNDQNVPLKLKEEGEETPVMTAVP